MSVQKEDKKAKEFQRCFSNDIMVVKGLTQGMQMLMYPQKSSAVWKGYAYRVRRSTRQAVYEPEKKL